MIVRKEGSQNSHRDFKVRKVVVLRALQWLRSNNKYYRHIELNQVALDQLPENGDLTSHCGVSVEDTCDDEEEQTPTKDGMDPCDVTSFFPVVARKKTEEETIQQLQGPSCSVAPDR